MKPIKESDWKVFKAIKSEALDTFCKDRLREYNGIINDTDRTAHERYLDLYQLSMKQNKKMARLFDGHSRSKAFLQLLAIRSEGLASPELVNRLSEDLRVDTDPSKFA